MQLDLSFYSGIWKKIYVSEERWTVWNWAPNQKNFSCKLCKEKLSSLFSNASVWKKV